ncbi:P-loop containing nucleoside triphosphate hydrolase protein [Suillus discolor]|uniref:P-loop containing nucleoside triphosphate hydrolase protein n=1 Tax=Suillus discolor TaxID=1912936 RepID=A0A9P7EWL3_9AGAM|nr:P-loop containing nucleoside triphosphate hydrolase protein [Suillus discolor]KAG2095311.1 P-loop containing nucleoside triphosphate hydrolase protein [Suillus discolor]
MDQIVRVGRSFEGTFRSSLKWAVELFSLPAHALECVSPDDSVKDNTESPMVTANKGSKEFITTCLLCFPMASQNIGNDLESALEEQIFLHYCNINFSNGAANLLVGFLHAEELQQNALVKVQKSSLDVGDEWNRQDTSAALEDINLTVHKGELVGVLGSVGSGKSSLLSAIIGDVRKTEGEVALFGNVAYAAQTPWILSALVRGDILFSHEYDEALYNLVIEACALKPNLDFLLQGDLTEVGEKAITLPSIPTLPDTSLIMGPQGLLATKARVLVTNSISYLKYFDQLVYLRRGMILESGK